MSLRKWASSPLHRKNGFTIVELLIVIVVIGILAAIITVSYSGVRESALEVKLKSDASTASTLLEAHRLRDGSYPDDDSTISTSAGVETNYVKDGSAYCMDFTSLESNRVGSYYISSSESGTQEGLCPASSVPAGYEVATEAPGSSTALDGYTGIQPESCPSTGGAWTKVPGNSIYGTDNGFCVQTYPASNVGGVATSVPNANRWAGTAADTSAGAQTNAATAATGAHLFTEYEWMTMAANAAAQASNWSGGSVGSGTLPKGSSTSTRGNIAHSVILSNGERVYFDTGTGTYHAVNEFTCYTGPDAFNCGIQSQHEPSPANALYTDQFNFFTSFGSLPTRDNGGTTYYYGDPRYANASLAPYVTSTRTNGIGYLRSTYASGSTLAHNFTRGAWTGANTSGLFSLYLYTAQNYAHSTYGFRAAK